MPCNSNEVEHFEIDITEKGMKLTAHGYKGGACIKESEPLERAVGTGTTRKKTADFFAKIGGGIRQKLGGS